MTSVHITDKSICTCALHNWMRITNINEYLPQSSLDLEYIDTGEIILGSWRQEVFNQLPTITDSKGANHTSR